MKKSLEEKRQRVEKLREEILRKKEEYEKLFKELQEECSHKEVWETLQEEKDQGKICPMWFPVKTCILCGLKESKLFGFKKLKDSKVIPNG
jgi:RecA-family ATPase